jgi:hypothetical protein
MGGHERGMRFWRRAVGVPRAHSEGAYVQVPYLVTEASSRGAGAAVLAYRGHTVRRPIAGGVVVGAFWDDSEPAARATLTERLRTRAENADGRDVAELAHVLADLAEVEPLLRGSGDLVLSTTEPPTAVADRLLYAIEHALRGPSARPTPARAITRESRFSTGLACKSTARRGKCLQRSPRLPRLDAESAPLRGQCRCPGEGCACSR